MSWICPFLFLFTFFPKSLGNFESYACWSNIISNLSHEKSKWNFQNWYKKKGGGHQSRKKRDEMFNFSYFKRKLIITPTKHRTPGICKPSPGNCTRHNSKSLKCNNEGSDGILSDSPWICPTISEWIINLLFLWLQGWDEP